MSRCRWSIRRLFELITVPATKKRNALGRSRGGSSTKINARTSAAGLPIALVITPGQNHDVTAFPALKLEVDCGPQLLLGDKGYDCDAASRDLADRGGQAMIPTKQTARLNFPSTRPFIAYATASSGSSIV